MNEYTIYLKNGTSFVVCCEKFVVTYSHYNGKIVKYEYENVESNIPIFIDINDISAVIQTRWRSQNVDNDGVRINPDGHTFTENWP